VILWDCDDPTYSEIFSIDSRETDHKKDSEESH
jgi:WD40 repeat protein